MLHDEGETSYMVVIGMMDVEEWKVAVVLVLGVEKARKWWNATWPTSAHFRKRTPPRMEAVQ